MSASEQDLILRARRDLAQRLDLSEDEIAEESVEQDDFPDAALGAPIDDEMSAQVITPGWRIRLSAQNRSYEYRAAGKQLRLVKFNGRNHRI